MELLGCIVRHQSNARHMRKGKLCSADSTRNEGPLLEAAARNFTLLSRNVTLAECLVLGLYPGRILLPVVHCNWFPKSFIHNRVTAC